MLPFASVDVSSSFVLFGRPFFAAAEPTLITAQPDEYEKLGSYAMIGLPDVYTTRYGEFRRHQKHVRNREHRVPATLIQGAILAVLVSPAATGELLYRTTVVEEQAVKTRVLSCLDERVLCHQLVLVWDTLVLAWKNADSDVKRLVSALYLLSRLTGFDAPSRTTGTQRKYPNSDSRSKEPEGALAAHLPFSQRFPAATNLGSTYSQPHSLKRPRHGSRLMHARRGRRFFSLLP